MDTRVGSTTKPDFFIWTIYSSPSDYPGKYVARKFNFETPTKEFFVADSLLEVRRKLPRGLFRLERDPRDEPQIVEIWL